MGPEVKTIINGPVTSSKLFKKYASVLRRLRRVNIEDSVFIHSSLLFKKVLRRRKSSVKTKDLLKIFTVCVFISFKFVVDDRIFYAKDYSKLTGMD